VISLPLWALFTIGFGSPLLAFLGVLAAQAIARKGAGELETRSKREETMRNLRWAAELSARHDERLASLGVAELKALLTSTLLEEGEKTFVEAALGAVYGDPEAELEQLQDAAEVVQYVRDDDRVPTEHAVVDVSSESETEEGRAHG
jgi:hypothetical protein